MLLFDREPDASFLFADNVEPLQVGPPARHPWLWQWWFQRSLPAVLKKYKPDVLLSPDGFLPLKVDIPTVLVIHDLGFEHYPEHTPPMVNRFYRRNTPKYAKAASRIVTVSEFSRQDIIKRYHIDPEKVDTVYNGANELYQPIPAMEQDQVRQQYTTGAPYFLYVGSIHPRKNVEVLLRAFEALKTQYQPHVKLVLAGRMAWKTDKTKKVMEQLSCRNDVVFTGHLQQEELARITASAAALVFPSLFEGFGIPVVEARYSGIPVICSNSSSLPEVAGPDALYFDPEDVAGLTDAMMTFLEDQDTYAEAFSDTLTVRTRFNWDRSADGLEEAIHKILPDFIPVSGT